MMRKQRLHFLAKLRIIGTDFVQESGHLFTLEIAGGQKYLLDLLNELKIPYNVVTNGLLLKEKIISRLLNSYCVGVGVSLDSADPETYAKIRKGGDLEKEILALRKHIEIFPISDWFEESFFSSKMIVYLKK